MEENIIPGNNNNNFLLGTPLADLIFGEGGDDKIVGRGDNDQLYGDFIESLALTILFDSPEVIKPPVKPGDDTIKGNKGDDFGVGDYGNVEIIGLGVANADIGYNIVFEDQTANKKLIVKLGDDCFYGGLGNDEFIGDAVEMNVRYAPNTENNTAIFRYGKDCIDLGRNDQGLQTAIGDAQYVDNMIAGSDNTLKHYFGDDLIRMDASVVSALGAVNTFNNLVQPEFILVSEFAVTSGDVETANTRLDTADGANVHYEFGWDKLKLGKIEGKIAEIDIDRVTPGELIVGAGVALVTGDGKQANTIIDSTKFTVNEVQPEPQESSNHVLYEAGNDKITIGKAEGAVIVGGDFVNLASEVSDTFAPSQDLDIATGPINTFIAEDNNTVKYYLGDDKIKVKATVEDGEFDLPTVIFGDAGQASLDGPVFSEQGLMSNDLIESPIILNPVLITVEGEGNQVIYHDGDDKINVGYGKHSHHLGKGEQVIYADSVYQIARPIFTMDAEAAEEDLLNDIQIIRGNDVMAGGKDADIFVFQILELLEDKWIGPGKDVIKDFNPYEGDMLRFITTEGEVDELVDSIAYVKVKHGNTLIKFDDGSHLKLVDFKEGQAFSEPAIEHYVDKLIDQGALEVFGLNGFIPLGQSVLEV